MISIIVPFYNTDVNLLIRCIKSIVAQTYPNMEIILIDDGSDAYYSSQARNVSEIDSRVRYIRVENGGVSRARNIGISHAKGEYICFIDSDDMISPNMIESGIKYLQDFGLDIVIGRMKKCTCFIGGEREKHQSNVNTISNSNNDVDVITYDISEWVFSENTNYNNDEWIISFQALHAKILRTELAREFLFPEGIAISEDTIWNYNLLKGGNHKIGIVRENWYYYCYNENSVLHNYNNNFMIEINKPIEMLNKSLSLDAMRSESYVKWVIIKIKQLVRSYYLHPNNPHGFFQNVMDYVRTVNKTPYREVLHLGQFRKKTNIQIIVYRTVLGFMYLFFRERFLNAKRG